MGALDVCPFIPVQDVSVEECVEISKKFGQKMAKELGVPVFLYGYASEKDYRKTMPQVSKKRVNSLSLRTTVVFSWKLKVPMYKLGALIGRKYIFQKKDPLQDLLSSLNAVISTNERH